MKTTAFIKILIATIAGAVLPLAFAPYGYYLLAIISPAILLTVWIKATPKQAFVRGLFFGLAFFGFGVYWVYISVYRFGGASVFLAALTTALLIIYMALFPACQGYLLNKFFSKITKRKLLLAFPASWIIFEWLREWLLTGFPWLFVGYTQIDSPLRGFAPLLGVYGVSFATIFTSAVLVSLYVYRKKLSWWLIVIAMLVIVWDAGFYLSKIKWTKNLPNKIQVSLIQGNVPLEQKWDGEWLKPILNMYAKLSRANFSSQIIIWPEAAIPVFPEQIKPYLQKLSASAKRNHVTILSGAPFYDEKNDRYYNGIISIGENRGQYFKRHLVPFGEYLPFKKMLHWLHDFFIIPMSDFSDGDKRQSDLIAANIIIAPFICYEITYPSLVLSDLPKAQLLMTISDDSWFGKSAASAQQLEMARMRSLEVGRYQLLSTNNGITAVVDPFGKIIAIAPEYKRTILTMQVTGMTGATPWVSYGWYLWPLIMLVCILCSIF